MMKKASKFEKVAARCWNLLNEGKPFTPIFVIGTMLLYHLPDLGQPDYVKSFFFKFFIRFAAFYDLLYI